jgi:F-type H+-transporting ATPase subunit b
MIELINEPETWVAVAFVIFVGILIKLGVPDMLFKQLDDRSARIKAELDEALKLRKEAEGVLAEYRRKQGEAEKVAESIIVNARSEAERLAAEAKAKVEDFIARRTKMAEAKIAQAEAQALADVRSAAADAAVAAAEKILVETTHGPAAEALLVQGIRDLKAKLN